MKTRVEVRTQQELDEALKHPDVLPVLIGSGLFTVMDSSHVEAWDSSHVEAWDSSHVEAWGSSHVEARGSSHVEAWGSSHVVASRFASIRKTICHAGTISGGIVISDPEVRTPTDWCEYYGVPVVNGVATLFKAVRSDYRSSHGFLYLVGATNLQAPDWDGGKRECGGGLHLAFHPLAAKDFDGDATRFLACPVAIDDIAVHFTAQYPTKVKVRQILGPIVEVDRYGKPINGEEKAA